MKHFVVDIRIVGKDLLEAMKDHEAISDPNTSCLHFAIKDGILEHFGIEPEEDLVYRPRYTELLVEVRELAE